MNSGLRGGSLRCFGLDRLRGCGRSVFRSFCLISLLRTISSSHAPTSSGFSSGYTKCSKDRRYVACWICDRSTCRLAKVAFSLEAEGTQRFALHLHWTVALLSAPKLFWRSAPMDGNLVDERLGHPVRSNRLSQSNLHLHHCRLCVWHSGVRADRREAFSASRRLQPVQNDYEPVCPAPSPLLCHSASLGKILALLRTTQSDHTASHQATASARTSRCLDRLFHHRG